MTERTSKVEQLLAGLANQAELMDKNAALMTQLFPDNSNARELAGAARITRDWIDAIGQEAPE